VKRGALLIATPTDRRAAALIFVAGAGLGYFLELWAPSAPAGHITRKKRRRCSLCWRTGLLIKSLSLPPGAQTRSAQREED
jgi:hypothetical protein